MDFYTLITVALIGAIAGWLLGKYDRTQPLQPPTTPDNPMDIINNLRGQVAAQRTVLQKWTDEAVELGFDGVHDALNSIARHRHIKIHVIASAKGFVRPYRDRYEHTICGAVTRMGNAIAETYARNPKFYSGTYCVTCRKHRPLSEFIWEDGSQVGS